MCSLWWLGETHHAWLFDVQDIKSRFKLLTLLGSSGRKFTTESQPFSLLDPLVSVSLSTQASSHMKQAHQ